MEAWLRESRRSVSGMCEEGQVGAGWEGGVDGEEAAQGQQGQPVRRLQDSNGFAFKPAEKTPGGLRWEFCLLPVENHPALALR